MSDKWYKLDNAAKIYPVIASNNDPGTFRLSAVLTEDVDPSILAEATEETLNRFPMFSVRLKKGLFWYYLDHNDNKVIVSKMSPFLFGKIRPQNNNDFLFTVSYYGRRISMEIFHVLSDGTGGMEFFKSVCYCYLIKKGYEIKNTGEIKTNEFEKLITESTDSFVKNYDKNVKAYGKEGKAFSLEGTYYENHWTGYIQALMSTAKIKEVAKKYDATITEYVGACILYSIYQTYYVNKNNKKIAKLFIPVNARKFFDSQSLRNFVLYIRVCTDYGQEVTFPDLVMLMKNTFEKELNQDNMMSRLVSNVRFEKYLVVRCLPLFLKKIAMKIGYKILGPNANTLSFSNLGIVEVPNEMKKYVERFEFAMAASKGTPLNMTAVSYDDSFIITFTTKIIERTFIMHVIRKLSEDGIEVTVETNDLEVEV